MAGQLTVMGLAKKNEANSDDMSDELMLIKRALEEDAPEGEEDRLPSEKPEKKDAKETSRPEAPRGEEGELERYAFDAGGIPVTIRIVQKAADYTPQYVIQIPLIAEGTKLILNALKADLITQVKIDVMMLTDPRQMKEVRAKFEHKANELLEKQFTGLTPENRKVLTSYLLQHTLGLGELEVLMADENLEDIAINSPSEPIQVYHKRHGWCSTNLWIRRDETVYEYASIIGRRVGRQINVLNPIMNAYLQNGDRINATLSPLSSFGNTMSIRKFAKNPWTIPYFIELKTVSPEVAALIWLCIQNEISLLSSGGTGSGKTSFLNAMCCMIPPNQRIISIEDTRELTLPDFLHWIAMTTREPNPEGKGEVTMLDLMVNSLRQRPDRIIVGEVRRQREAEVLFEAMHTGHSVYATIHADNANECITRLTTPPINLPKSTLPALGGIIVQYRNRRSGIRRTFEFAEITNGGEDNVVYRWDPKADVTKEIGSISRLGETLALYTGMTAKEMKSDLTDKVKVLKWMVSKKYFDINAVGRISADYYRSPDEVMDKASKGGDYKF
ncbi:Type II/IV secretion system protein [uncultured archaeon]|nr:Type II/IV secretion system protein [uncultured archaeon]